MSRRELARRSGISKQTIHNLEHSTKGFHLATFEALDRALKWQPGTAEIYHAGNQPDSTERSKKQILRQYLTGIMIHLARMDIDDLERELLMLEEESFGRTFPTNDQAITEYEAKLQTLATHLSETWESLNGTTG